MGQNVKEAGIVVGESQSMDCLLQDSVYVNASQKKTSWIDLGIDANSTDFIAADAFKCIKEEGEGDSKKKVTNYYLVVTDKSEDDVIDRAKQLFGISDEPFELVKRFMLAKKGQVGRLDESKVYVQSHTGAILWSMPVPEMISVDSDVSSMMLSSLETLSAEYQISGLSGEMETKIGNVHSLWNFDKAQRISLGEALAKEASESQGQEASCRVDVELRVGRKDNTVSGPTEVDYLELSSLVVSCDTNFYSKEPKEMQTASIQWTSAQNGQPALQIYNFDNATQDLTGTFQSNGMLSSGIDVLVRYNNEIHYATLKVQPGGAISVDTDYSSTSQSIQKQNDGVVKINGWDTKTAKSVTEVSSYADDYDVLLRHHTDGKYQTEFINIAPLLSGGGSAPEKRKISKNWDWPTDLSGNYIAPGAPDATMAGYYIYGHHNTQWSGNIPAQPANKNTLILSVEYGGNGYPNNVYLTWTQNIDNSSLSGIGIPLYARQNSPDGGPTYDYNAGLFTIPVYE